jgi:hypothetical protein
MDRRPGIVVVSDGILTCRRRDWGVGEPTRPLQVSGSIRGEVVVDGEASGSSGEARGGVDQRRRCPGSGGSDLAIPTMEEVIGLAIASWRTSDERGGGWCEESVLGVALFIESRGAVGFCGGRSWRGASGERRGKRRTASCRCCPGDTLGAAGVARGRRNHSSAGGDHHSTRGTSPVRTTVTSPLQLLECG